MARLCTIVYPEAIALVPLFASPYWRQQAQQSTWNRRLFNAEIARRFRHPDYRYKEHDNDPISHWANMNAKRSPLAPIYVHDQKRHLRESALSPATRLAQQRRPSTFDPSHRAGEALVAHRYLATVFRRAWDPVRRHVLSPSGDSYYRLRT
ncbi:hypothetical protein [Streptomyces chrestomyceticus]|uniref:hypothetical protein n=1 Tax=Streptomyces chrestomyceticus TaxID=68185 RepID=UPI0035A9A7F8